MKKNLTTAIRLTLVCIVCFCFLFPLLIWGIAQVSPGNGKGETIVVNGQKHYANIGQQFVSDRYFWSRPSAVNYNAAGSAGSNKGPSNPEYLKTVQNRIDTFLKHNPGISKEAIPVDLVTASGSGLDPHISVQGALVQIERIEKIRGIDKTELRKLIEKHTESPLFGPEKINVLKLNIALDQINETK
ncbi:K(+)-transporting ATPase subunit C [Fluviicola sp.]|jgi:K+-transporting ATPase ATPase C chain|uniref:K(+)-transporting ATPase subunit C n=1 Tax=Fluviicola sp. TaxID=1917219 RepID=UPI00282E944E|nr:K(+)-transporting ATPase subunit C [Fluviicola sp.]MDR0801387.1 K(+)-transporting ATPase subunit C [Fluviicola sp.]